MFHRLLTVHCLPNVKGSKHDGIKVLEFDDIHHGEAYQNIEWNSTQWTLRFSNDTFDANPFEFVLPLQSTTQSLWVGCNAHYNYHIALLPLSVRHKATYEPKRQRIQNNFAVKVNRTLSLSL